MLCHRKAADVSKIEELRISNIIEYIEYIELEMNKKCFEYFRMVFSDDTEWRPETAESTCLDLAVRGAQFRLLTSLGRLWKR